MKTTDYQIQPGESYLRVLAKALEIPEADLAGILPVQRYLSAKTPTGIVCAFGGAESGMAVFLSHESIPDIIKTLEAALDDAKN